MSSPPQLALREQAALVAAGALDPLALHAAVTARIAALDPELHAVCALAPDDVVRAETARSGPLGGVPVGIKDMFALPWRAPTDGASVPAPGVAAGRSGVYAALARAGAAATVVTNMHQLGVGTSGHVSAYGATANPWARDRCAGGSSGGSAAAVAARLLGGAIGTDAGGSIRVPAAWCGVTGLKATWGAIRVDGYTGGYSSLGAIGPLARDAADCRLLGEALLGRPLPAERRPLRIGLPPDLWGDLASGPGERCREALAALGAPLVEVEVAHVHLVAGAAVVATGVERLPVLGRAWLDEYLPLLHPAVRGIVKARFLVPADLTLRVARLRTLWRRGLAELFGRVDLLAWPTVPAAAPPLRRPRLALPSGPAPVDLATLRQTGLANLTGVPALSVPAGLDPAGLPVGLQLVAPWGAEALLLEAAERIESATGRAFVDACPPGYGAG